MNDIHTKQYYSFRLLLKCHACMQLFITPKLIFTEYKEKRCNYEKVGMA